MRVKITDVDRVERLELINPYTWLNVAGDVFGQYEEIERDDEDNVLMDLETYRWWEDYFYKQQTADFAAYDFIGYDAELRKEYEDYINQRWDGNTLEYLPDVCMAALNVIKNR